MLSGIRDSFNNAVRKVAKSDFMNRPMNFSEGQLNAINFLAGAQGGIVKSVPGASKILTKAKVPTYNPSSNAGAVGRALGENVTGMALTGAFGGAIAPAFKGTQAALSRIAPKGTLGKAVTSVAQGLPYTTASSFFQPQQNKSKQFAGNLAMDFFTGPLPMVGVAGAVKGVDDLVLNTRLDETRRAMRNFYESGRDPTRTMRDKRAWDALLGKYQALLFAKEYPKNANRYLMHVPTFKEGRFSGSVAVKKK